MPVYAEATILELPRMWINAGARGWLVALCPDVLKKLNTTAVNVAR
jgi:prolyl-tRNA editing enzyme YbaK/EbsC (Cys-tRNA(Pro) deacylase)